MQSVSLHCTPRLSLSIAARRPRPLPPCPRGCRSELQLWPQDLPRRALVVLSGEDDLVPSQLVLAQLKTSGHPATVMHHPDLGHGGILLAPEYMAEFVARLRAMLAR